MQLTTFPFLWRTLQNLSIMFEAVLKLCHSAVRPTRVRWTDRHSGSRSCLWLCSARSGHRFLPILHSWCVRGGNISPSLRFSSNVFCFMKSKKSRRVLRLIVCVYDTSPFVWLIEQRYTWILDFTIQNYTYHSYNCFTIVKMLNYFLSTTICK